MEFEEKYRGRIVPVCPYCNQFMLDTDDIYIVGDHIKKCEICGKLVKIKTTVVQYGFSTDKQRQE